MCIPRVAPDTPACQSTATPTPNPTPNPAGDRIDGFPRELAQAGGRDRAIPRAREDALARRDREIARYEERVNSVEFGPSCPRSWADRREGRRVHAMVLTDEQRERARRLDASARACGLAWKAWRRWKAGEGTGTEWRLIAQTHCGLRACDSCDRKMREWQQHRCEGPWSLFLTLTMPRSIWSHREAWEGIHEALRVFFRELRRTSARRFEAITAKTERGRDRQEERRDLALALVRGPEKLDYAWCLEAHRDGYPHVHMVTTLEWVDFGWIRELWARCIGAQDANVDGRRVTAPDGVCRYLAKYIAKGGLSLDILAIIKGRRTWASTLISKDEETWKWQPEGPISESTALKEIAAGEAWGARDSWSMEAGKAGGFGLWKRSADKPSRPIEGAKEFDNIGTTMDEHKDYMPHFIDLLSLHDSSIIPEEWLCDRLYGKNRAKSKIAA